MIDDLPYVRERIADYRAYADEDARHDSDMRVRAFVGERLSEAQTRCGDVDDGTRKKLDEVLMRCMFSDQVFVRKFEHARLDAPMIAALVRSDRHLIELGESLANVTATTLGDTLTEIDKAFEYRRGPDPVGDSPR